MKIYQKKFIKTSDDNFTSENIALIEEWSTGQFIYSTNNNIFPAYRLRIQTIPGVLFNINNSLSWCQTGYDGVYELDLGNSQPLITSLRFSKNSLQQLVAGQEILVEIFYDGGYK